MSLKFGVLGLLAGGPLHGYEVKSRFEDMLGGTWEVNVGQVYATLQRLERDGLVEPVGERGDRGRQAYAVTAQGSRLLEQWLGEPERGPVHLREEIFVKLLLSRRLGDGSRADLLHRQRRAYLQRLKDLGAMEQRARTEGRDDLVVLARGGQLHTEADLKWLDELVVDDARGAAPRRPGARRRSDAGERDH